MPIYEYQCKACGHRLDTIQKFSDAPLTLCPSCQQSTLQKLISVTGFQLKGSGWYATDYKPKPATETAQSTSTTDSTTTTTTETSTPQTVTS